MMYMEEVTKVWVAAGMHCGVYLVRKDVYGHILERDDDVALTKEVNVTGENFTAKLGAAVRNSIFLLVNKLVRRSYE
jgi:uncharacterized Zn ribbon protein